MSWWVLVTLAGVAALPVTLRLLAGLPDRGVTLARPAGMLLVGFVYWWLASAGFVPNAPGSVALAWLVVLVGGLALWMLLLGQSPDLRALWRQHRTGVVVAEVLFLVMFVGWAAVRAAHPSITSTEKPMELAFISGVLRSEVFPPLDPWLSGYAISYYYFGYVMAGMLAMVSGVSAPVAFNLMVALLFALTGLAAFAVVYNMVRAREVVLLPDVPPARTPRAAIAAGLLGACLLAVLGNFQTPLVELPYQSGWASQSYLRFWNTQERVTPRYPAGPPEGDALVSLGPVRIANPARWDGWWWFRASRVVQDFGLDNQPVGIQPIDEFPQFSFLLADVHPHVLALPFAVLAVGLALNLLLTWRPPTAAEGVFYGLAVGGLAFLNTWDGPIYLVLLAGVDVLRRLLRGGTGRLTWADVRGSVLFAAGVAVVAFVLMLPWLVSFRSQASGVLPNLVHPTSLTQFFVMFGPFVLLLGLWLGVSGWRGRAQARWGLGLGVAFGVLGALAAISLLLASVAAFVPSLRGVVLREISAYGGWGVVLPDLLLRRVTQLAWVPLVGALAVVVALLFPRPRATAPGAEIPRPARQVFTEAPATLFALLLVAAGAVLCLTPEWLYLRDNFGTRINTVFKFYYQAWALFSVAAAYGMFTLLTRAADKSKAVPTSRWLRPVSATLLGGVLLLGLLYPAVGVYHRTGVESGRALGFNTTAYTLDGGPGFVTPDDNQAITCLARLVQGDDVVVAEAVGGAYNPAYGRVGALSGIPVVMGWANHQRQWRGPTYSQTAGTREQDIPMLYNDLRWEVAASILQRYSVDYVFYGTTERRDYSSGGEEKFLERLPVVCAFGDSRFYQVTPMAIAGVQP